MKPTMMTEDSETSYVVREITLGLNKPCPKCQNSLVLCIDIYYKIKYERCFCGYRFFHPSINIPFRPDYTLKSRRKVSVLCPDCKEYFESTASNPKRCKPCAYNKTKERARIRAKLKIPKRIIVL